MAGVASACRVPAHRRAEACGGRCRAGRSRVASRQRALYFSLVTDLAVELDQKLMKLAPAKARALERLVREAMALADAADIQTGAAEAGSDELLSLRVRPLPLTSQDFERLREALDEPPRDLPRLRELLHEPNRFGHA